MTFEEILKRIKEAQNQAIKEHIQANTIFISERLARLKPFALILDNTLTTRILPPMILGMEIKVTDELPEEYDFAITRVDETERERIKREGFNEAWRCAIGKTIGILMEAIEEIPLPERRTKRKVKAYIKQIVEDLNEELKIAIKK